MEFVHTLLAEKLVAASSGCEFNSSMVRVWIPCVGEGDAGDESRRPRVAEGGRTPGKRSDRSGENCNGERAPHAGE